MEMVVTTGAIRHAQLQSNLYHQQTNTQIFTGRMPFLSPNQQSRNTEQESTDGNPCCITIKRLCVSVQRWNVAANDDAVWNATFHGVCVHDFLLLVLVFCSVFV